MKQAWEAKKVSLKASLDEAREKRGKAIQKIFDQFENLLGHKARARWSGLIVRTCVKDHPATEPAPPPELSMKNLQKCHREFWLDVFQQDAAENQREYLQHCLKMPWEMYLRAWVTRIRHLPRMVRYLPCLADMEDAPAGIERANRELSEIELCQLIMRAIPSEWRESYRCLPQGRFTRADSDKLLCDIEPLKLRIAV